MFINGTLIKRKYSVQETKLKKDINQIVYDPRIKEKIYSDNPALILAKIITKSKYKTIDKKEFWNNVKVLADYCDQRI